MMTPALPFFPDASFKIERRWFLKGASACILLSAAGCQTSFDAGDAKGASLSSAGHLARIRAAQGLSPLVSDSTLEKAARHQAAYMARAGEMTHDTGRGRDFATRMHADGVAAPAAENVAYGRMDLDRLFSMWVNSPGHRRNMLDSRFNRFGLASAADPKSADQRYWALVLSA